MSLLNKAINELSAVDKSIDDLMRRKAELQAFVNVWQQLEGGASEPKSDKSPRRRLNFRKDEWPSPDAVANQSGGRVTKKEQILSRAHDSLVNGGHIATPDLAALLIKAGIDLGSDPNTTVSVILSRDARFKSERAKGGWTLVSSPNKEETPQGVAAPEGSELLDFFAASSPGTGTTPD